MQLAYCVAFSQSTVWRLHIEANKKVVNFLDVTLNLDLPYNKPRNIPLYINKKSNHPPRIIENIPKSISKRLSEISIDEDSFSKAAPLYQKALADSGYNPASNLQPEHSKDQLQLHAESKKIDGYNKSTLRKTNAVPPKACNCRQPPHCPLDDNCLKSAVIYRATVATEDNRPAETYVGLTENSFQILEP